MKLFYAVRRTWCLLFFVLVMCGAVKGQVEFRYFSNFGTAMTDINDSGVAVMGGAVYYYAADTIILMDTGISQLNSINNNGDLAGLMPITINGQQNYQAAYKKNGVWYPVGVMANATQDAAVSVYQISEDGNYIAGQSSPDCCDFQAFLYNIGTGTLETLDDPANEYGAGYCVNNSGVVGGWYDPQPQGTQRVPAVMTTGSVVTNVPPGPLPMFGGQVSAISNNNVIVGDIDNVPMIYDQTTGTATTFPVPAPYQTGTFTSVSETGVAVGYYQIFDFGTITRDAIIYHPSLGSAPLFLKDVLLTLGVTVNTPDGLLGTAIAISPDGNFICGWENAQFFFAKGWVINLDDALVLGAPGMDASAGVLVRPNPSTGVFSFAPMWGNDAVDAISVYNAQGKLVIQVSGASIDVTEQAPGFYYYMATSKGGKQYSGKLMKQ